MEAPEFFIGGYYSGGAASTAAEFLPEKRMSDQKNGDHFAVDDLLDFPNDDDAAAAALMNDGFFDNITSKNCTTTTDNSSTTFTSNDSSNSSISGKHFGYQSFADSYFSSELCVPYDDLAELEWLSNFVEDSFSTEQNLQVNNFHILSGSKPPTPASSSSESHPEPSSARNPNNPMFQPETPLPGKARSKRSRAAPCDWSTRLLHLSSPTTKVSSKKQGNVDMNSGMDAPVRKCLHCAAEKTPQWRTGPMGPKTLCNACGVRYKSGRLVAEYRPAASPTFVSAKHSNSHRKVLELRRQKELQRAQQEQYLHQSSIFGVTNGGDDFLIHHHSGPNFRHMI
ncbi:GATA transcription factor 9 [Ricinus communis]|uniref:GATA transcription factor n=1 Tax=Ricinus communis TaxID=3988 RepID=B9RQG2_RICCO|nr:GATA transcription factor 9 [Ricinus communis]EEF46401.1 GATA transcription factor, putative [Ricinus communis]|eukprot:XP_002515981.1 GATA transcription factor 9 [Ricinus communis]